MNKNVKSKNFRKKPIPTSRCSCGKTVRQKSRTNYPFGVNGNPKRTKYYKCTACNKRFN